MVTCILVGFVGEYYAPVKKDVVALMGWYKLKSKANDWIRNDYRIMLIARCMMFHLFLWGLEYIGLWEATEGEVRTRLRDRPGLPHHSSTLALGKLLAGRGPLILL